VNNETDEDTVVLGLKVWADAEVIRADNGEE
jgi:hypothetical protein